MLMRLIRSTLSGVGKGHTKFSVLWKRVLLSGECCEVTQENDMQRVKGAIQKVFCSVLGKVRLEHVIEGLSPGAIDAAVELPKILRWVLLQSMTVTIS